jgi:polar amino acid transport system permease protein
VFFLVITVPLTHLVNYIDKKLRTGRKVRVDDPEDGDPVEIGAGGRVSTW